jgi:outer membrane protein TolC
MVYHQGSIAMRSVFYLLVFSLSLYGSTLEGLIDYAMKHSTVVKQGQAQMELSHYKREESRSEQFGSIDLLASYTHFNLPRTLVPLTPATMKDPVKASNVATTKDMFGTGIAYTIPLFTGYAQTRQVEMDEIASQISKSRFSLTKEQLAYNVASLYLSALALQEMSQAQRKHVSALRQLAKTVRQEVELGKKAQIDLLKAQKDLYGNIAYLEVLKGNIAMTKAALASLVGKEKIGKLKPVRVSVKRPHYNIEKLLGESGKLNRMKIAQYNVKKADKQVKKSQAGKLPQVALNSYFGYNYGENDSTNLHSGKFKNEKSWQIGLNAQWNVFDFGKRDASIQRAKIAQMQAAFEKEQTLLDFRKSLTEALERIKQSYANYRANLKQLALAKKSEKIEHVRYLNGVSTINDLLYAKSQTHLAAAKLIESRYNYQKGKFTMDYLLERGVKR